MNTKFNVKAYIKLFVITTIGYHYSNFHYVTCYKLTNNKN